MTLSTYWGLFLNATIPLEMALNWCDMSCHYCFANLNSPSRKANVTQIMGLIANYKDRDTYEAKLLQMGYPICISNHVDPLAHSNWGIAQPILEALTELDIPFTIQSKLNENALELIKFIKPSVFYVSIMTLDAEVTRRVEPGTVTPVERLRIIEKLVAAGHRVSVGINPCVPEWIGDPMPLCKAIAASGAESAWVQPLHLSMNQIKNIPEKGIAAIGEVVLTRARKFRKDIGMHEAYLQTRQAAVECGLEVYDIGQRERSNYFDSYRKMYAKTFPTLQDFVNYCYDSGKKDGEPIFWDEFRDFFVPKLPKGVFPLRNHLGAVQSKMFWADYSNTIPTHMTYQDLLQWCWEIQQITYNPVNAKCFAWAGNLDTRLEEESWIQMLDYNQMPILLFKPNGTDSMFEEWDGGDLQPSAIEYFE